MRNCVWTISCPESLIDVLEKFGDGNRSRGLRSLMADPVVAEVIARKVAGYVPKSQRQAIERRPRVRTPPVHQMPDPIRTPGAQWDSPDSMAVASRCDRCKTWFDDANGDVSCCGPLRVHAVSRDWLEGILRGDIVRG